MQVSIQLLFLFNPYNRIYTIIIPSFNTASVLIQLIILYNSINRLHVSIQLLFLFNQRAKLNELVAQQFQYSFCSYSTYLQIADAAYRNSFNTASVLIQPSSGPKPLFIYVFQYSFCSYSTRLIKLLLWWSCVSIQLLFLFNRME